MRHLPSQRRRRVYSEYQPATSVRRRARGQVKLRGGESFFTWNSRGSSLKTKMLGLAWSLHFQSPWGRRTEDPFRGLRAGPVRYSPFFLSTANPQLSSEYYQAIRK